MEFNLLCSHSIPGDDGLHRSLSCAVAVAGTFEVPVWLPSLYGLESDPFMLGEDCPWQAKKLAAGPHDSLLISGNRF